MCQAKSAIRCPPIAIISAASSLNIDDLNINANNLNASNTDINYTSTNNKMVAPTPSSNARNCSNNDDKAPDAILLLEDESCRTAASPTSCQKLVSSKAPTKEQLEEYYAMTTALVEETCCNWTPFCLCAFLAPLSFAGM